MKKATILLSTAVLAALLLSLTSTPMAMEARLVGIHAKQAMPEVADSLADEPAEVQAAMLDMDGDALLRLKAQAALLQYPELAREVFPLYAAEPEFHAVLREHGPTVLPPIGYFIRNDIHSLAVMESATRYWRAMRDTVDAWWNDEKREDATPQLRAAHDEVLNAVERGWYAIHFIAEEGNGFLGQFALHADGSVKWLQSERMLEATTSLIAGGIRELETRYVTGEQVRTRDIGWAVVDAAVMVGAVKLLRAGRTTAAATRTAANTGRAAALASRFATTGRLIQYGRYAKWPMVAATVYLAVRHPGLISDALATVAHWADLPVWLVQFLGWFLLLAPLLYVGSWMMRWLVRPTIALLSLTIGGLRRLQRQPSRPAEQNQFMDQSVP